MRRSILGTCDRSGRRCRRLGSWGPVPISRTRPRATSPASRVRVARDVSPMWSAICQRGVIGDPGAIRTAELRSRSEVGRFRVETGHGPFVERLAAREALHLGDKRVIGLPVGGTHPHVSPRPDAGPDKMVGTRRAGMDLDRHHVGLAIGQNLEIRSLATPRRRARCWPGSRSCRRAGRMRSRRATQARTSRSTETWTIWSATPSGWPAP